MAELLNGEEKIELYWGKIRPVQFWAWRSVFDDGWSIGVAWKPDPNPQEGTFRWLHKIELTIRSPFTLSRF